MLFSSLFYPDLPTVGLSDDERALIGELSAELNRCAADLRLSEAYYLGTQVIDNLRIAVPAELEFLRTIVGWPALAVDPYVERLSVDGFRLPNATDADSALGDLWTANHLDAQLPLGVTDALSLRSCYWLVGSPVEAGDAPVVTVESPLNMAVKWDLRGTRPLAAWQTYFKDGRRHAALMVPRLTTHLATNDKGEWEVVDRDEHDFDFVPVHRMAHMPRTSDRGGRSAITPAIRSVTDSACRDLMALEVAREIYSVPGITLLGAAESAFQNTDGTAKSAWDAYITRVRVLERTEDGETPTIHQAQVYDPSVFTKLIDMRASMVASMVAAPPQDLGLYTQGNPTSADSAEAMERRRNRRAKLMQQTFGAPLVETMQTVLRFQNGGSLPAEFRRIEVDWTDVDEVPLSASSDAVSKLVAAGSIPPTSDVTLKRAGFNAVERARLEQDRKREDGRQAARTIAESLTQRAPEQASGIPAPGR